MDKLDKYQKYEKEFQAELTAYTICSHFGIDTSEYSLKYLHDWTKDRTLNDKKALLKEVRETMLEYIEKLEKTLMVEKNIEQNQHRDENKVYESTEVTKLDKTKEIVNMYQFNDKPEKCFLGKKVNNTVKKLGVIGTIETVKKEFIQFEKEKSITLSKGKTEIPEITTKSNEELSFYIFYWNIIFYI